MIGILNDGERLQGVEAGMERTIAILALGLLSISLLGVDKPSRWWQPLHQLKAWRLNQKGQSAYRTNEPDKALKAFQEAREIAGEHPILRFNEGTALMALKRYEEAERSLRSALKGLSRQSKEQAATYYNLGNLYFAQRRWDEAARAYIAALKLTPNDWNAKFNLELVLRHQKKQPPQSKQQKPPTPPPPPPVNEQKPLTKQMQGRLTAPWHGERDW